MTGPWTLLYSFTATLLALLGLVFVVHDPRSRLVRSLCGVLVSAVGWLASVYLVYTLTNHEQLVWAGRAAFAFADLIPVFSFLFVCCYPDSCRTARARRYFWILYAWSAALTILTLATGLVVKDMAVHGPDRWWIYGRGYSSLFVVHFAVLVLATLFMLVRRLRGLSGSQKRQLVIYAVGWAMAIVFGSLTNVVLPHFGYHLSYVGPFASLLYVAAIVWVLIGDGMVGVRIFWIELLVMAFVSFQSSSFILATFSPSLSAAVVSTSLSIAMGATIIVGVWNNERRRQVTSELAKSLEISNERYQKLDKFRNIMLSIASHQLRGQLGGVRGYLTMMRDGDLGSVSDKQKGVIAMNLSVLSRLLSAVDTFLDAGSLETGKIGLRLEVVDMDEVVRSVFDEFKTPIDQLGLEYSYENRSSVPVLANVDADKVKHIVFNIIDNALKFTKQGSICVTLDATDSQAVIRVADTGVGVSPDDLGRLFRKFEDGGFIADRGGFGLGLYIVRMLTEMQGGRVWAESAGVGQGTVFSVTFPLAKKP
jgi:signal transduction histidine kinase